MILKTLAVIFLAANPLLAFDYFGTAAPRRASEKNLVVQAAFLPLPKPNLEPTLPIRNHAIEIFQATASSAFVFNVNTRQILFAKEIFEPKPIASLTKLMTATLAVKKIPAKQEVIVSQSAIDTPEQIGNLAVNEKIGFENLLHLLLLSSSNDAAAAIAENYPGNLIEEMNQTAKDWGLEKTVFEDPHGLSPNNRSNAWELAQIMAEAIENTEILSIMQKDAADVPSEGGLLANHHVVNTNKLLNHGSGVFAGKTGYTEEAGQCMVVASKAPNNDVLITVVLNAPDRINETRNLLNWTLGAYIWR